jgi:hypothetical protein
MTACGYFAFTRRHQIEAKIWHVRHGYSTGLGNLDVPVPEHWLVYLQNSLDIVLVNTAPTWHRDGKFHTAATISVSTSPMSPNASNGMNFWLQWKRQRIEHDGVKLVEEKRVDFDNDTAVCIGGSEMRDVILRGTTKAPLQILFRWNANRKAALTFCLWGSPPIFKRFTRGSQKFEGTGSLLICFVPAGIDIDKSASHQLSQSEIGSDNPCSQHLFHVRSSRQQSAELH